MKVQIRHVLRNIAGLRGLEILDAVLVGERVNFWLNRRVGERSSRLATSESALFAR